jgi:hypothetical protein
MWQSYYSIEPVLVGLSWILRKRQWGHFSIKKYNMYIVVYFAQVQQYTEVNQYPINVVLAARYSTNCLGCSANLRRTCIRACMGC